jgi:glycerol-3-phosphate dehydrogenase
MVRATVCVIGGGIVGTAVALALARRDVEVVLLEAERELGLGASGTNSGILHTGFDSSPGELETRLIIRSAGLRDRVLEGLGVPVVRCGAEARAQHSTETAALDGLEERATGNGVHVIRRTEEVLEVPGEAVTDPVRLTLALAKAAEGHGAAIACSARVQRVACGTEVVLGGPDGELARCRTAVNCAGLHADEVAQAAGDDHFRIVPRKGEFVVFEAGADDGAIRRILLPVPSARTKGVLVFPTTDGRIVAGPTARDQESKRDWSVAADSERDLIEHARRRVPELEGIEPIASYAGLRPAGAANVNYLIERSPSCPRLIHVAAIRSTGLSACFGIAEHVTGIVAETGVELGPEQPLASIEPPSIQGPWWARSAEYWA